MRATVWAVLPAWIALAALTGCQPKTLTIGGDPREAELYGALVQHRAGYAAYLDVLRSHYVKHGEYDHQRWAEKELGDLNTLARLNLAGAPPAPAAPAVRTDAGEVDLVEGMSQQRSAYEKDLAAMHEYYLKLGDRDKEEASAREKNGFDDARRYAYLVVVDLPPADVVKPQEKIAEADALFEEGMKLFRGGRIVGVPFAYDTKKMRRAVRKLDALVRQHPTSDKVAEALYHAGFILKEYLDEDLMAIEYLRRAYVADPKLALPAHFERAVALDYRLRRRDEALAEYRKVLETEAGHPTFWSKSNSDFAAKRIKELTGGK